MGLCVRWFDLMDSAVGLQANSSLGFGTLAGPAGTCKGTTMIMFQLSGILFMRCMYACIVQYQEPGV